MISLKTIDRIEAFSELNDSQLNAVREHCLELDFQRDDKLFAEGDDASHLWFVLEGQVDLRFEMPGRNTSKEHMVSSIGIKDKTSPAKALGWSCFVPPHKMRLSAYCVSRTCKVIRIKKDNLLRLFETDPRMGYTFMSHMITVVGHRFHQLQDYVAKHIGESLLTGW